MDVTQGLAQLLVDQRKKACPERRHRTRSTYDEISAVNTNAVTGVWICVASDIGHSTTGLVRRVHGGGHIGLALIRGQREERAHSSSGSTVRAVLSSWLRRDDT